MTARSEDMKCDRLNTSFELAGEGLLRSASRLREWKGGAGCVQKKDTWCQHGVSWGATWSVFGLASWSIHKADLRLDVGG